MKRKTFTSQLKAKVAIQALKGHQMVNQIATEFGVHPSQASNWKKQLLEDSSDIFSKGRKQQEDNARKWIIIAHTRTTARRRYTQLFKFCHYISSLSNDDESINKIIRAHWGVENSLYWVMDVVFGEDYSRIRSANGAENMSMIKHVALNELKAAKPRFKMHMTIQILRKNAGWDDDTLEKKFKGRDLSGRALGFRPTEKNAFFSSNFGF